MTKQIYKWQRFWQKRGSQSNWKDSDGLLSRTVDFVDSTYANSNGLKELDDLLETSCLVLLGEPGMGKSVVLSQTHDELAQNAEYGKCEWLNLPDYSSAKEVVDTLFHDNSIFQKWIDGDFLFHIFLDSLDESPISPDTLGRQLRRVLENYPKKLSDIRLCIACRTINWPVELETHLQAIWDKESVQAYELAPLRRQDIELALEINDLSADDFWREVRNADAEFFAARPITLGLLIDEFDGTGTGQLPSSKFDLYKSGCLKLCQETSSSQHRQRNLEPEQRLKIAARIAAHTIFCSKSSISLASSPVHDNNILELSSVVGGTETVFSTPFPIYEAGIRETLEMALFVGSESRSWTHQTYAEFLAASYVVNQLEMKQMKDLLFHPSGNLIPQLHGVAAWIASLNDEIRDAILTSDPEVLLMGDTAPEPKLRQGILRSLLRGVNLKYWRLQKSHFRRLKYPGMNVDLDEILTDKTQPYVTRVVAIEIAIECRVAELVDRLTTIALDNSEKIVTRNRASDGVLKLGAEDEKLKLKPLAFLSLAENRDLGELKLDGIQATWPHALTVAELFDCLEAVPRGSLIDTYSTEDWNALIIPHLMPDNIHIAFQWVQNQNLEDGDCPIEMCRLIDGIIERGWNLLDQPGVLPHFAELVIAMWSQSADVLIERSGRRFFTSYRNRRETGVTREMALADSARRHLLFDGLLAKIDSPKTIQKYAYRFVHDLPLVSFDDLGMLRISYNVAETTETKVLIINIIRRILNVNDPKQFQAAWKIKETNDALWKALEIELVVGLDSESARQQREAYAQRQMWEARAQPVEDIIDDDRPSPSEYVSNLLQQESLNAKTWWLISRALKFNEDRHCDPYDRFEFDVSKLPVWQHLNESQRLHFLGYAGCFLEEYEPNHHLCLSESWWHKYKNTYYPIVAGCQAFSYLWQYNKLETIAVAAIKDWTPALTYYYYRASDVTKDDRRAWHADYLPVLRNLAPGQFRETILWIIEVEAQEKNHSKLPELLEYFWDEQLVNAILHLIQKNKVPQAPDYLTCLMRIAPSQTYRCINQWLDIDDHSSLAELTLVKDVGTALLQSKDVKDVSVAIRFMLDFPEIGKTLIETHALWRRDIWAQIEEAQLADLYLWIRGQYPPNEDPPDKSGENRMTQVTPRREIAFFRDVLLQQLAKRGTIEAVEQIQRISNELGIDLSEYKNDARETMLRKTWQPIHPTQLQTLLRSKQIRWIQNESQLLDVVVGKLEQLQSELQGTVRATSSSIDLWNESQKTIGNNGNNKRITLRTPKDENRLSDYIERYLTRELKEKRVFVDREVQIERGNFTDVLVETFPEGLERNSSSSIIVIVEVKGDWHSDVFKAMKGQLADRYLAQKGLRHGVFLVGKFFCTQWDSDDDQTRWTASRRHNSRDLVGILLSQADELERTNFNIVPIVLDCTLP